MVNVGITTYLATYLAKVIFRIYKQGVEEGGINPNASGLTASSSSLVYILPYAPAAPPPRRPPARYF